MSPCQTIMTYDTVTVHCLCTRMLILLLLAGEE